MAATKQPTKKARPAKHPPATARGSQTATALRIIGTRQQVRRKQLQQERDKRSKEFFRHLTQARRATRGAARASGDALPPLRILAEGDSWFDYPSPGGSIITHKCSKDTDKDWH